MSANRRSRFSHFTRRGRATPGARRARTAGGGVLTSVLALAVAAGCAASADARASGQASARTDDPGPVPYQVGLAREGNVVVVLESTGWAERTEVALELALERAIPGAEGRCGENVLPCPLPARSDVGAGPLGLTASPLLTDADWARITRGKAAVVTGDGPPTPLVDCVSVAARPGTTDVRAASFNEAARPASGLNEFVLRYEDDVQAADAVARIREQFLGCPDRTPAGIVSVQLHEHSSSDGGTWWLVDEAFVGDRTFPGREPLTPN